LFCRTTGSCILPGGAAFLICGDLLIRAGREGAAARYFWAAWTGESARPHMCGSGIVGDFLDHAGGVEVEADAAGIFDGDVESFEDEVGTAEIDGVAGDGVDDFHERGLDGLLVFDERDGMEASFRRSLDAAQHALMEVAELLSAQSGRAAADPSDLDVRTELYVWHVRPRESDFGRRTSDLGKNVYLGAKIFVSLEMLERDLLVSGQNIELEGVAGKIL
jgi:hypothetical protein